MGGFWEAFEHGSSASIVSMGNEVTMGGVTYVAVLQPRVTDSGASLGGIRDGAEFDMLIEGEAVAVADGMEVVAFGVSGAVMRWERLSANKVLVTVGPREMRWEV